MTHSCDALVLLLLLLLLAGSCASAATPAPAPAAVQPRTAAAAPADTLAYVAFVNDVHDRKLQEDPTTSTPCSEKASAHDTCVGGWPRISTAVQSLRRQAAREGAAFFFLDAGDEFTGTLFDVVYQGQQLLPRLMNAVRPDALQLGNHELDFGPVQLGRFLGNLSAATPVLGCNIDVSGEPALRGRIQNYTVLTYKAFKIGVVGWITPTTGETSRDVGGTRFRAIVPSVQACLADLRREHPRLDFVIGLSHSGYESDIDTAKHVTGLDVIIGGHSHTFLYTPTSAGPIVAREPGVNASNCVTKGVCDQPHGPYPTYSNNVPIVQAYYSSKYLGLIKINLSQRRLVPGLLPLLLGGANSSSHVAEDPAVLEVIQQYRAPVDALMTQVAGRTRVPLEGDASISRVNETNLGSYVCDAFLRSVPRAVAGKARASGSAGTLCLMNAGGIRSGYQLTGDLTVGQVMTMLPYANAVAIFTIKGAAVLQALQHGLSAYPSGGRFLQVAGVRYLHTGPTFVSAALLSPDGRSAAAPIQPTATYTVVSTDYMMQGGDGFVFEGADVLQPAGLPYAEQVIEDLKLFPDGITPACENRIVDCGRWPSFAGCPAGQTLARVRA